MDSRKIVFKEAGIVLLGEIICGIVMCSIFALLNRLDSSVIFGALIGIVLSTGNFFFMAVSTCMAADKAEAQDVKSGRALVQNSYFLRLLVLVVVLFACGKSGRFNPFALVLPLLFVRPTLTLAEFFRKPGENKHER